MHYHVVMSRALVPHYWKLIFLLISITYPTCQTASTLPDLIQVLPNLLSTYTCDFSQQNLCRFNDSLDVSSDVEDGLLWSFRNSRRELAEQLRRVAEAALIASESDDSSLSQFPDSTSFTVPVANYFPCAVPNGSSDPNPDQHQQPMASLHLRIPWPHLDRIIFIERPTDVSHRLHARSIPYHPPPSFPVVCLHLQFRFPVSSDSQIRIGFDSNVLSVRQRWSASDGQSAAFLDTQKFRLTPVLPTDVWINLHLPLDAAIYSASKHPSEAIDMSPFASFEHHNSSWVVYLLDKVLLLQVSQDVCLNNITFISLLHTVPTQNNTCTRSLSWIDPQTESIKFVSIDSRGLPILNPVNTVLNEPNSSVLRFYDDRNTFLNSWFSNFRLTGSLVLAIAATLFFLLFVCAVSISILMAYSHQSHHPDCCPPSPSAINQKAPSNHVVNPEMSVIKYPLPLEFSPLMIQDEPNSTQCGESLFQNECTDTLGSSAINHVDTLDGQSDVTQTSAAQLMRNWYFYRRRANRVRSKQGAMGIGQTRYLSTCPNPTASTQFPVELYRHQPRPIQRPHASAVVSSAGAGIRNSLMLHVGADNQLIIKSVATGDSESTGDLSFSRSNDNSTSLDDRVLMRTTLTEADEEVNVDPTCLEMAESVRHLDGPFPFSSQWSTVVPPPSDSNTPATRACSRLSSYDTGDSQSLGSSN